MKLKSSPKTKKNRNHWDSHGESPIQFLVMHYTACDFPTTLKLFTANIDFNRVSAHYVITENEESYGVKGGIPFQVVPEDQRAWHAGLSFWNGTKNLYASSIGIENINKGFIEDNNSKQLTWFPFDPAQIHTLGRLSQDIITRYKILPQNVVDHAGIASSRKQDPGILFPWGELYTRYGVGAWLSEPEQNSSFISTQYLPKEPLPQGTSEAFFLTYLRNYGYECLEGASITPEHHGVVKAFKSHFSHNQHPEAYKATIDEKAMLWIWGLNAKYK